ncbi:MAG TPA: carboxypeptidase-like regulatory domain-containing protein, partial [Saprospiraceae bacterium]|nr:carboxypeptidase-like regulatory domain-containing protein [Saprospiraceae bacterium]
MRKSGSSFCYFSKSVLYFTLISLLSFFSFSQAVFAQQITINGKLTDKEDSQALIGVSIVEKGTVNGAISDIDGNYKLEVASNAILIFSYVGYETIDIEVNGRTTIDVIMHTANRMLEDVIV